MPMTTLYVAMEDALLVARERGGSWTAEHHLEGQALACVAVDPRHPERIYAGTKDRGLWRTDDAGRTWTPAGSGIAWANVTAVAVAPGDGAGPGEVYAGTEPSAVFRSTDGGGTWTKLTGLAGLPSASTWSFPPRPETHHVRWIGIDPHDARRIYAAIEAGALIRSLDGGDTWLDRAPDGPYDTHTLALHPHARGRLYSAAGDGYYQSRDEGRSWENDESGLRHTYLFGVAVDPADPERVVVSAASGPGRAYSASSAASFIYTRTGSGAWVNIRDGLPEPKGTTISVLASAPDEAHVIYAANNRGIFRSRDTGSTWERLSTPWAERFLQQSTQGFISAG